VQGVFFRASCRRAAEELGVSGWIRNREDGAVEAVFEGERSAVEAMVGWMSRGPEQARVTDVQVNDEQPAGETGFRSR
jgi:acylphosphatase